ncbi:hypothetical protein C0993_001076, partial [Termitomyces sp. T159_Od127]
MNLHSDFSTVCTLLTTQADELTLATVEKVLTDQEDTQTALNPDAVEEVQAMYGRIKKGRSSQADSDDEEPLTAGTWTCFHWKKQQKNVPYLSGSADHGGSVYW